MPNQTSSYPRVGVAVIITHPKCQLYKDPVFLLGLRKGSHGSGTWGLPGGHLEQGESFQDCAEREVWEEIGFKLENLKFLTATNDVFHGSDEGKHYITIWMTAHVALDESQRDRYQHEKLEAELKEPHKCKEWRWFSWEQVTSWVLQKPEGGDYAEGLCPFLPLENLARQWATTNPLKS